MPAKTALFAIPALVVCFAATASAQTSPPSAPQSPAPATAPQNTPSGQVHGAVRISMDQAIQMALQHNHNLKAARTTIQQDQALEITANLRPNPVLTLDAQFLPIFQPSEFTSEYIDETAQFDVRASDRPWPGWCGGCRFRQPRLNGHCGRGPSQ